jgi:predicted ATPase
MNEEDQKLEQRKLQDDKFEENMHKQYTDIEEEYHAAYPNRPMPWTWGFLTGLFSRSGKGMLLWALVGAAVAVALWIAYMIIAPPLPQ